VKSKQVLTASEAAEYIGVSMPTLYSYLKNFEIRQKLGAYKTVGTIGTRHHWRFRLSSLKLFLQGNGQCTGAGQANAREKNK